MNDENQTSRTSYKKWIILIVVTLVTYALSQIIQNKSITGSSQESSVEINQGGAKGSKIPKASGTSLGPQEEAIVRAIKSGAIDDLRSLAVIAVQYRMRPVALDGGQGSYAGFKIPKRLMADENAMYHADVTSPNQIRLVAISARDSSDTITVRLDADGNLSDWTYAGAFKYVE